MNFSTMFVDADSGEYWPELQAEIDRWQQKLSDDPGALNQLVFAHMEAADLRRRLAKKELARLYWSRYQGELGADLRLLESEAADLRRQLAEAQAELNIMSGALDMAIVERDEAFRQLDAIPQRTLAAYWLWCQAEAPSWYTEDMAVKDLAVIDKWIETVDIAPETDEDEPAAPHEHKWRTLGDYMRVRVAPDVSPETIEALRVLCDTILKSSE